MRWDVVGLVLGWTIRLVALPLLIVSLFSILDDGFSYSAKTYFLPLFISGILGQLMISLSSGYEASKRVRDREAFASVALGWIPVVLIGALPFWLGGMFYGPFEFLSGDASFRQIAQGALYSWFESMSGFTTTGASVIDRSSSPICREMFENGILNDCIGSQPKSLLLWRSLTQWFGGMGVIMLGLLIFSRALGGGKALARAELTGPTVSNLSTTLEGTARKLWAIYIVLTIIEGITLYQLTDMGGFNSLNYALTTMPSGGFGTSDLGIMAFDDPLIESIILIFMLLTCINFTLLYFGIAGRWSEVLKDEELRTYLLILLVAWIAMGFNLNRATDYTMIE